MGDTIFTHKLNIIFNRKYSMITRQELEQKVIDVVKETLALDTSPTLQQSFKEDLKADSIDIITLLVSLEDELDSSFDQNELGGKNTLIEVVDYLDHYLQLQRST